MQHAIAVTIELDGHRVLSSTRFVSAGAHMLAVSTTIPCPQVPVTLHSSYVGHRDTHTAVTHLLLAPGTPLAQLDIDTHAPGRLAVDDDDRHPCLYDHLQRLLAALQALGHQAAINVADSAVELIDR